MLVQIITENGQKKVIPLTADAGAGNPVGTIIPMYKKSSPSGYLYCDGSTFDQTAYPLLYAYLGSNVLPDYREFALVGAEENTTSSNIAVHDIYTQGEEKDDQILDHKHFDRIVTSSASNGNFVMAGNQNGAWANPSEMYVRSSTRKGTVNRGKRKAVFFYIKATSGLSENAQDNVVAQLNEERSYSTEEINTGKKWIDGKPIYRKVVNYGQLPNNTRTEISHNITNIENVIKAEIIAKNTEAFIISNYGGNTCSCYVNQTKVSVRTDTDLSSYSGVVVIEYTKNT